MTDCLAKFFCEHSQLQLKQNLAQDRKSSMVADNYKVPFKCRSCTAEAEPRANAGNQRIPFMNTSDCRWNATQLQSGGYLIQQLIDVTQIVSV